MSKAYNQGECVKVMVRCRPLSEKEQFEKGKKCVTIDKKRSEILLVKLSDSLNEKVFTYNDVFGEEQSQQDVYESAAFSVVESVISGFNGTIFAYGQTGSGKTYTMMGDPDSQSIMGIIPRSFRQIIDMIQLDDQKTKFLIFCSYLEIYNEEIHDLLGKDINKKYDIKENPNTGVYIKDLSFQVVNSVQQLLTWMHYGNKNRHTGETLMNKDSSRSHSIFTVTIEAQQGETIRAGKLNLVDLAGSERQSKTHASGDRLKEATKINLSLSALGNVISALVDGKRSHIPYRDSKLTRLLQDSLGGNTKTVMIANLSPSHLNYDENLSTLRYASRAKNIINQPRINEDPKDALIKEYAQEIDRLKQLLQQQQQPQNNIYNDNQELIQEREERKKLEQRLLQYQNQTITQSQLMPQQQQQNQNDVNSIQSPNQNSQDNNAQKYLIQQNKLREKYKLLKQKLKQQEQQQKQNEIINDKQGEEILFINQEKDNIPNTFSNNYSNYEKQRASRLAQKYKSTLQEIEDLNEEHEREKEYLLDDLRSLQKDLQLQQTILNMILKPQELKKIMAASIFIDRVNEFRVPIFVLQKDNSVHFPQLKRVYGKSLMKKEKNERVLQFESNEEYEKMKLKHQQQTKQQQKIQIDSKKAVQLLNYDNKKDENEQEEMYMQEGFDEYEKEGSNDNDELQLCDDESDK